MRNSRKTKPQRRGGGGGTGGWSSPLSGSRAGIRWMASSTLTLAKDCAKTRSLWARRDFSAVAKTDLWLMFFGLRCSFTFGPTALERGFQRTDCVTIDECLGSARLIRPWGNHPSGSVVAAHELSRELLPRGLGLGFGLGFGLLCGCGCLGSWHQGRGRRGARRRCRIAFLEARRRDFR